MYGTHKAHFGTFIVYSDETGEPEMQKNGVHIKEYATLSDVQRDYPDVVHHSEQDWQAAG